MFNTLTRSLLLTTFVFASTPSYGRGVVRCYSIEEVCEKISTHQRLRKMCGPLSVLRISSLLGKTLAPQKVITAHDNSKTMGFPLQDIVDLCQLGGLHGRAINAEGQTIMKLPFPCILLVGNNQHCVVLESVDQANSTARVWDPSILKSQDVGLKSLNQVWSHKAIIFGFPRALARIIDGLNLATAAISLGLFAARLHRRQPHSNFHKSSTAQAVPIGKR